jgi:hypothetical protein
MENKCQFGELSWLFPPADLRGFLGKIKIILKVLSRKKSWKTSS